MFPRLSYFVCFSQDYGLRCFLSFVQPSTIPIFVRSDHSEDVRLYAPRWEVRPSWCLFGWYLPLDVTPPRMDGKVETGRTRMASEGYEDVLWVLSWSQEPDGQSISLLFSSPESPLVVSGMLIIYLIRLCSLKGNAVIVWLPCFLARGIWPRRRLLGRPEACCTSLPHWSRLSNILKNLMSLSSPLYNSGAGFSTVRIPAHSSGIIYFRVSYVFSLLSPPLLCSIRPRRCNWSLFWQWFATQMSCARPRRRSTGSYKS